MNSKKILIADDNQAIGQMLSRLIERTFSDITVDTAGNGEETLTMVSAADYDLVFLDIHFGETEPGGMEILKKIQEICPAQKVCLMTGYAVAPEIEKISNNSALGIIKKPFEIEEIYNIIMRNVG